MFGQLFGNYLVEKSIITNNQLSEVLKKKDLTRVKLGLIAVSEKLITKEQADEINYLQITVDKRFGDIAVEKGYITTDQLLHLLSTQGNSYYIFVQSLINLGLLSLEEFEKQLNSYKLENNLSDVDIDAIKSCDIDRIIPIFVTPKEPYYQELIGLVLRTITRFIDRDIRIDKGYYTNKYEIDHFVGQTMQGDHNIISGFSSKEDGLLTIANPFAKENFTAIDEDSVDSVGEFLNSVNGLFARKLSNDDIIIDMLPPITYSNKTLLSGNQFYVVPVYIKNRHVDFIVSIDHTYELTD